MNVQTILYATRYLVKNNIIPQSVWKRLPVNTVFNIKIYSSEFKYSSSAYDSIGRIIFWGGEEIWEHESTYVFSELAKQSKLVLDIGANTGIYSLIALSSNPLARAIAFEPVPKLRARLTNNIQINDWCDRCKILPYAVAEKAGVTKFHIPDSPMPTTSSLHTDGFRGTKGQLIDVEVVTIDQIIDKTQKIDLIKIDIEGFEHKALEGMREVLQSDEPIFLLECNPDGPSKEIENILNEYNYMYYHLRDSGIVKLSGIIPDNACKFRNFLCVPPSKASWLGTLTKQSHIE